MEGMRCNVMFNSTVYSSLVAVYRGVSECGGVRSAEFVKAAKYSR